MEEYREIMKRMRFFEGRPVYGVFSDWVAIMALSIQNACDLKHGSEWTGRENQYAGMIKKYTAEERRLMTEMTGLLMKAFELQIWDFLGEIYMESMCNGKKTGQFFTPFHISVLAASLGISGSEEKVELNEPSCGSGGMILAAAEVLRRKGRDYRKTLDVTARDIDATVVHMCYVQLSLAGIKATVIREDALCDTDRKSYSPGRVFLTPGRMRMT